MRFACSLAVLAAALIVVQSTHAQDKKQTTEPEGSGAESRSGVGRVMERTSVQNHMKQLALFYRTYETENGVVKDVNAFKTYIRRDAPKIVEQMDAFHYIVVPNVRNPGSNDVIAFERIADRTDQHVVAMGDGSVQQMNTKKLRDSLKK